MRVRGLLPAAVAGVALAAVGLLSRPGEREPSDRPRRARATEEWAVTPPIARLVTAVRPAAERLAREPDAYPGLRARWAPEPPSTQHPDARIEAAVRRALTDLRGALDRDPPLRRQLAGVVARAETIAVLRDDAPGAFLRADVHAEILKVPPCVLELRRELFAGAIAHELTHLDDHLAVARSLGADPAALALAEDELPADAQRTIHVLAEARAFRVEVRAVRALGVEIPRGAPRAAPPAECHLVDASLLALLSEVAAFADDDALERAVRSAGL